MKKKIKYKSFKMTLLKKHKFQKTIKKKKYKNIKKSIYCIKKIKNKQIN